MSLRVWLNFGRSPNKLPMYMGHGQYLIYTSKPSKLKSALSFSGFGKLCSYSLYSPLYPHGFPARDEMLLGTFKCSTMKQKSRTFIFFMERSSPLAQPPLSHHNHHYHPPLSPPPLSQPPLSHNHRNWRKLHFHIFHFQFLREVSHENFVFTSSIFTFWGKSRTKALFSYLQLFQILREVSHENFIFTSSSFISTTHSGNIWALPCLALACCSSWTSNARQEKQFFSEQWASVWPRGIMWFFGYRFVIIRVIVWDNWLDQKNLQNNDSGKPFFWKFLMLSWTKLEAAAENEKRKLQKA